jgi:hypothetical protein
MVVQHRMYMNTVPQNGKKSVYQAINELSVRPSQPWPLTYVKRCQIAHCNSHQISVHTKLPEGDVDGKGISCCPPSPLPQLSVTKVQPHEGGVEGQGLSCRLTSPHPPPKGGEF